MKIAIDFGHGTGQDRGAVGNLNEEVTVREFGPVIIEGLKKLGNIVYDVTPKQSGLTLAQSLAYRVNMANYYKVDLFVSLHLNAFNTNAHGCEVEYISVSGKTYADKICKEVAKLGFENRGAKARENLYVLKYTNMPAILIESFFCDNISDCNLYNKNKLANAIIKGITDKEANMDVPKEQTPKLPDIDYSIPKFNGIIALKGDFGYIQALPERGRIDIHLDRYNYLTIQDDKKEGNKIILNTRTKGSKVLL
ncbi:N-acetylmuramoyl-L-alanine amidase [Clostridium sp. BSD9I1]|uniref:N-acetylmuramoyl-L-alanine amidase n=1 Tax=Clostridium sp. BSD9I1 TaxID=2003589 RepID=UPI001646C897|nr:N-acetylmuramoyl-L-alanine amidase [Clostridium sp. BSD9I1]